MSKFKRRISLILSVMMLSLTILPLFVVNAADITYTAMLNGTAMSTSTTYEVEAGDTINFTATSSSIDVALVGYRFNGDASTEVRTYSDNVKVTIPEGKAGSTLKVNFAVSGYDASRNVVRGDWKTYTLVYATPTVAGKDLNLKFGSKTLAPESTTVVNLGDSLKYSATPSSEVAALYYAWGTEDWRVINASSGTIIVPTDYKAGAAYNLYLIAKFKDGQYSESERYIIKIAQPTSDVEMVVKMNGTVITSGKTYSVKGGETITATATCLQGVAFIGYKYAENMNNIVDFDGGNLKITLPKTAPAGTRIRKLYIEAVATNDDGEKNPVKTGWVEFIFEYPIDNKDVTLKYGSKTLAENSTTEVFAGDFLTASAVPSADVTGLYYAWGSEEWRVFNKATGSIDTADLKPGSYNLYLVAKYTDGGYSPMKQYVIKIVEKVVGGKAIAVSYKNQVLPVNSTTTVYPGEAYKITATPAENVVKIYYRWSFDTKWSEANGKSEHPDRIPQLVPDTYVLYVSALYDDGKTLDTQAYNFVIPQEASNITMNVKLESSTMTSGKTYEVVGGEDIRVNASVTNTTVDYIRYKFGNGSYQYVYSSSTAFEVPEKSVGTSLVLYVEAVADNGKTTGVKSYTLKFVDETNGNLDVEPWMEVNDELVELAVNLRNDSLEEKKANKNIYALGEVVTYYVDYKNGTGDDITSKVTLELELPLEFTVVDSDSGTVDSKDQTITWVFANGLEEDEAGTKVVKVKYTDFSKSRYDSETIYPSASIAKGSREQDRSTVINLIISEYGVEIDVEHEPYMYGDENADTFRPDDFISRAEGALVLARIYGLDYERTNITDVFSDLNQTYVEAQKAIIASTKAGLISGYTDGTFRPNQTMTRAEFMKILACMIEKQAEENDIEGLDVKDTEYSIKLYDDATRYYIVDGKKIYSHWALEEVSLLARLNMTPLSEDDDELALDEEITRAEVAQLVNFYLLRAPANVTSKTKSGFDDVSKRHDLFADIIEATREAHTFSMEEEDGTETAE